MDPKKIDGDLIEKKLDKARKYLLEKHIIAIDGSGEVVVEELLEVVAEIVRIMADLKGKCTG